MLAKVIPNRNAVFQSPVYKRANGKKSRLTLHANNGGKGIHTLWEPTPSELKALSEGGLVMLTVSGESMPMCHLGVMTRTEIDNANVDACQVDNKGDGEDA